MSTTVKLNPQLTHSPVGGPRLSEVGQEKIDLQAELPFFRPPMVAAAGLGPDRVHGVAHRDLMVEI